MKTMLLVRAEEWRSRMKRLLLTPVVIITGALLFSLLLSSVKAATLNTEETFLGAYWKEFLSSPRGHAWFEQWNTLMQAKFEELAMMAESDAARAVAATRGDDPSAKPYRILMVGDSTMKHQFGAVCGFLAERSGKRFDLNVKQTGKSGGCCVDTTDGDGGGRGLCFEYDNYRFLNPKHVGKLDVDAFYFGCGLHLLHITPLRPLEALRTQEWLAYEHLLEDTVAAVRERNGPAVKIAFMTTHTIASEVFRGEFADIRDAYRKEPGNDTIRAACNDQIKVVTYGDPMENSYPEHEILLEGYPKGEGEFTPDAYCREGLLDRHGTLQLNRRAKDVMMKVGVPVVDAGRIVEGQTWATKPEDGRHFAPLVPLELYTMLGVLTSPPPPPCHPGA